MAYMSTYCQPHLQLLGQDNVDFAHHHHHHHSTATRPPYQWHEGDFNSTPMSSNSGHSSPTRSHANDRCGAAPHYPQPRQLYNMTTSSPTLDDSATFNSYPFSNEVGFFSDVSQPSSIPATTSFTASTAYPIIKRNIPNTSYRTNPTSPTQHISTAAAEKLCPLISGEIATCQPAHCGLATPCLHEVDIPAIDECASVPFLPQSPTAIGMNYQQQYQRHQQHQQPQQQQRPPIVKYSLPVSSSNTPESPVNKISTVQDPPTRPAVDTHLVDAKQRAKQAHSLVERKYRENLNAKIVQLRSTLLGSHYGPQMVEEVIDDDMCSNPSGLNNKIRKGDVLNDAIKYVHHTEVEIRHMDAELHRLRERVQILERLVRCEDCSLMKQVIAMHMASL